MQGTRTFAQQQVVYDQGRTAPGAVVTKARPGDSYHQYGLAFDAVPDAYKDLPNWNPGGDAWTTIGKIGESLGLEWGGRWASPDEPHFQIPESAAPLSDLKAYYANAVAAGKSGWDAIMPITISPTMGALGIILVIGLVYLLWLRPMLQQRGYL